MIVIIYVQVNAKLMFRLLNIIDRDLRISTEFDFNVHITTIIVCGPFIPCCLSIPLMVLSISLMTLRHTHYIHYNLLIYNRNEHQKRCQEQSNTFCP